MKKIYDKALLFPNLDLIKKMVGFFKKVTIQNTSLWSAKIASLNIIFLFSLGRQNSPDLNPMENLWGLLKAKVPYSNKVFTIQIFFFTINFLNFKISNKTFSDFIPNSFSYFKNCF